MKVSEFDFDLPPGLIADRPAAPRDAARLLVVDSGLEDRRVRDLPGLLRPGDLLVALARHGAMPLPPYIKRPGGPDERDRSDYQTAFAAHDGAVAAPTAGLHFTPDLLEALDRAGIGRVALTLHVGAGTFLPVKA